MSSSMVFYGAEATSASAKISGRANGTLILDMRNWDSQMLSTMIFAILAQESVR